MNFTTSGFLLIFLPATLVLFLAMPSILKRWVILVASLVFVTIAQPFYLVFFLAYSLLSYLLGRWIEHVRNAGAKTNFALIVSVLLQIGLLVVLKYCVQFSPAFPNLLKLDLPFLAVKNLEQDWVFPLGFSYITFQMVSYFVDIENEVIDAEKNIIQFLNYILFFPKLISGPIQPYKINIAELSNPTVSMPKTEAGIRRFIVGLARKVLIADTIGNYINPVFNQTVPYLKTYQAWFVIILYAIQLLNDFSGYTDMAIGLGEMLGIKLMENFNWPFVSKSLTEFWRRWHISLSAFFRDYLFTPLQFRFRKVKAYPVQASILLVFLLTGLWHGLERHYIVWGLFVGVIIGLEATKFGKSLKEIWAPLQHIWTVFWVLMSWVLFRSPNLKFALGFYKSLFGLQGVVEVLPFSQTAPFPVTETSLWLAIISGVLFAVPVIPKLAKTFKVDLSENKLWQVVSFIGLLIILVYSIGVIASKGPMPGIYGQF
jgi:alginate O-acetyltransferase complex protein AlgI